jgi:tetratricopeptide (TPR) repeat protein
LLTLVFLEVGFRIEGLISSSLQEYRNLQSIKHKGAYRIMCLGESATVGQYPPFLEEILNQRNVGIRFSVIDKGIPGTNTPAILSQIESYIGRYNPDIVVVMMGINDWGEQMPYESFSDSRMTLFLKSLRTYKLARLLWLHISAKVKEIGLNSLKNSRPVIKRISLNHINGPPEDNYAKSMHPNPAEESFKKAIELNPQDSEAYRALGWLYRDQGKYPQAESSFKKAIELNPQDSRAYRGLGELYRDQGKYPQAEELFKKAIELNPQNFVAYFDLGGLYLDQGKYPQAEE